MVRKLATLRGGAMVNAEPVFCEDCGSELEFCLCDVVDEFCPACGDALDDEGECDCVPEEE